MSTPPNKRDQRREARKAQLANAQSGRRPAQDTSAEDVAATPSGPAAEPIIIEASVPEPVIEVAPPPPIAHAEVPAPAASATPAPARDTAPAGQTKSAAPGIHISSGMTSPAARTAGQAKPATRPTTAGPGKTPGRPTTTGAIAGQSRPVAGRGATATSATQTSEPDGETYVTKRDIRRENRKAALAMVQAERRRRIEAARRRELLIRLAVVGGIVLIALIGWWIFSVTHHVVTPVKKQDVLHGSLSANVLPAPSEALPPVHTWTATDTVTGGVGIADPPVVADQSFSSRFVLQDAPLPDGPSIWTQITATEPTVLHIFVALPS